MGLRQSVRGHSGHQAVLLAGSTGLAQVIVAVIYIVAARSIGPSALGIAAASIAIGTTASGFIDFGTNSHWIRETARGQITKVELGLRVGNKLFLTFLLCLLWTAVCLTSLPHSQLWVAAPIALSLTANQAMQVPLRGQARGDLVALVILTDRVGALILFSLLRALGIPADVCLWLGLSSGSILAACLAAALSKRAMGWRAGINRRINPWRGSRFFGIAGIANSAQALDLPLLSLVGGAGAAGLYGAVNRWTQPMSLLSSAFASASEPFVAASGNVVGAWLHLRRGLWMPIAAIVLSLGIFLFAPLVVPVLLGSAYADAAGVLRVLALVSIASVIGQPLVVTLQALGRDRVVALALSIAVLLQLTLVALTAPSHGALGAAFASLGAQIALLLGLGYTVVQEVRRSSEKK